jgi:hypothetical protein
MPLLVGKHEILLIKLSYFYPYLIEKEIFLFNECFSFCKDTNKTPLIIHCFLIKNILHKYSWKMLLSTTYYVVESDE